MTDRTIESVLTGLLELATLDDTEAADVLEDVGIADLTIVTFADAGVLTRDAGIVLKIKDAAGDRHEFQVTVRRSR